MIEALVWPLLPEAWLLLVVLLVLVLTSKVVLTWCVEELGL